MRRRIAAEAPWGAFWAAYSVVGIGLEVWVPALRRRYSVSCCSAVLSVDARAAAAGSGRLAYS